MEEKDQPVTFHTADWNPNQVVRIISIAEDGSNFSLDKENLHRVMQEVKKVEEPGMKLMVLSVVGDFRTGKSFLLSTFLRYLHYCEEHGTERPQGMEWLLKEGAILTEGNLNSSSQAPGFLWRRGQDRMTTGLQMYGRPFVRTDKNGQKVAILLMDTQGLFDNSTTTVLTNAIFGLSTLISSYEIYNVPRQLQEDKLQQLHFFTAFSRSALKEFAKSQKQTRDERPQAPFQHLDFLIRDWQNFSNDQDVEQCLAEMPQVLEKVFSNSAHENGSGVREQIKEAFETMSCFLLPHPGIKMIKAGFQGEIMDIEDNFCALLNRYVRRVFEENLVPKRIQNQDVNSAALELYIEQYARVFAEGKLPETTDLVTAIALASNLSAKEAALDFYKSEMKELRSGSFVSKQQLAEAHENARRGAVERYDNAATFGDDSAIASFRAQTLDKIEEEFKAIAESNELKMHQELQNFIFPLIAATIAFVLDKISDYTCDSWSTTCRDLSDNFAKLYYIVFLALAIKFGFMYHKSGMLVASSGFMKLGHATLERVNSFKEQAQALKKSTADERKKTD